MLTFICTILCYYFSFLLSSLLKYEVYAMQSEGICPKLIIEFSVIHLDCIVELPGSLFPPLFLGELWGLVVAGRKQQIFLPCPSGLEKQDFFIPKGKKPKPSPYPLCTQRLVRGACSQATWRTEDSAQCGSTARCSGAMFAPQWRGQAVQRGPHHTVCRRQGHQLSIVRE